MTCLALLKCLSFSQLFLSSRCTYLVPPFFLRLKKLIQSKLLLFFFAAAPLAPQPFVEESQAFLMSPAPLHMECSLDKEMYYHGESITVNVLINNNSNKTVKKIKITVRQYAEICLFSTAQYKCPVAELEAEDGFPLGPSTQMSKVRESGLDVK